MKFNVECYFDAAKLRRVYYRMFTELLRFGYYMGVKGYWVIS